MLRISSLPLSVSFTPPPQPDSTTTTTLDSSHPLPVCLPPSLPPSLPLLPLSPLLPSPVHFAILFLSPSRRFKAGVILSLPPSLFLFSSLKKTKKHFSLPTSVAPDGLWLSRSAVWQAGKFTSAVHLLLKGPWTSLSYWSRGTTAQLLMHQPAPLLQSGVC